MTERRRFARLRARIAASKGLRAQVSAMFDSLAQVRNYKTPERDADTFISRDDAPNLWDPRNDRGELKFYPKEEGEE